MSLERDLRQVMRRAEPPAGFAERVMERVRSDTRAARATEAAISRRWALRSIAAALVLTVGIGVIGYRAEQRRRGAEAAEQALEALRITSEKMNVARETIRSHGATAGGGGRR